MKDLQTDGAQSSVVEVKAKTNENQKSTIQLKTNLLYVIRSMHDQHRHYHHHRRRRYFTLSPSSFSSFVGI